MTCYEKVDKKDECYLDQDWIRDYDKLTLNEKDCPLCLKENESVVIKELKRKIIDDVLFELIGVDSRHDSKRVKLLNDAACYETDHDVDTTDTDHDDSNHSHYKTDHESQCFETQ
jgi:hypothetical protein